MPIATNAAQDPEVIAHLQAEAARSPRLFRLRLALLAILGDLALTLTLVLPWAAPIVLGTLVFNLELFYWLGGAAILVLAWALRPSFRFEGRELSIEEASRLREEIGALKRKLSVPGPIRVCVDESFNASAAETRGLFGVFGTRCTLTLGIPLLVALSHEQMLAVVAHELGHFSRRHGRLGHWLYRARAGWIQYAQYVTDSDSSFDRAAAWYAGHFLSFFSPRSFVHSRQCEYEADADAALAVGSKRCAEALTRVAVIGHLWEKRLPREVFSWQAASREPPGDFHERFGRFAANCSPAELQSWLDEALRAPSSWLDTHPSLAERLRSLREAPSLAAPAMSAGEALLGRAWPKILEEFNDRWAREVRPDWLVEHLRAMHVTQTLLVADSRTARTWDIERRLARARALRAIEPSAGLQELSDLYVEAPKHKRVKFAYAAALLNESDAAGVALMEALAREDAGFRASAFMRGLAYFERKGDARQIERWSSWLKRWYTDLGKAVAEFVEQAESGNARASSLPESHRTVVSEAARLDPCIAHAWLFEGSTQLHVANDKAATPLAVHLLALAIDPGKMDRHVQTEDAVRERYERLLRDLLAPDQVPVVRTFFVTEVLPAIYESRSALS
jgi:Zn-dependent protease with chaperone function